MAAFVPFTFHLLLLAARLYNWTRAIDSAPWALDKCSHTLLVIPQLDSRAKRKWTRYSDNLMKHIDIMVTDAEGVIRSLTPASAKVLGFDCDELEGRNFFELLRQRKDGDHIARIFDEVGEAELMLAIATEFGYSVLDEWMVDDELNVLPCAVYVYAKRREGEFVWVVIPRRGPLDSAPLSLDLETNTLLLDLRQRGGGLMRLSHRDLAIFDAFMSGQADAEIAEDLHITKGAVRYTLRRMVNASAAKSRKEMRRNFWYSISELVLPDARSYLLGEHGFLTQHKHIDEH